MKPLAIVLFSLAAFAQTDQKTSNENMVRDRGQTRPPDQSQSWNRGRIGTQQPLPHGFLTLSGTLVDGSCDDRTTLNLRQPPTQPTPATTPSQPQGKPGSASGVTVDAKTLQTERADVMPHQTPDLLLRQPDLSCAITGSTRAFALLLPDGRLLNLDEGGVTLATQAMNSLPEGRAVLNGTGPGIKPQVTLRGQVQGDRLIVQKIVKP
jgi:hypothetical protein